jgi:hypothetical protein
MPDSAGLEALFARLYFDRLLGQKPPLMRPACRAFRDNVQMPPDSLTRLKTALAWARRALLPL